VTHHNAVSSGHAACACRDFTFNPYCDIPALLERHDALIVRDDYNGKNRWLDHLECDLMKFWLKPEVKDMSKGLWRSFLTDDGKQLPGLDKTDQWPPELRKAIQKDEDGNYTAEAGELLEGPDKNADYNFVRAHSRQVFAYGIAFHMTGKREYFDLCRKGAEALLALVGPDGSMYTRQELATGKWVEDKETRTSQDLAYGMTGIGFYYYLTHDPAYLKKILLLKNYIFEKYYHPGKDILTWLPHTNESEGQSVELVSHLDQLYAYMLWLTPSLPQEHKQQFIRDMDMLVGIMLEHFYSSVYGTFWGDCKTGKPHMLGTDHTDFGHSVKAMWVIHQVGMWAENPYYMIFARERIHSILENAFDPGLGAWRRRFLPDGTIDRDKEWWSLAELDQAASLLAIKDPSYLQYINHTYPFWFKNMVDNKNGEIWHVLDGNSLEPKRIFPKCHCWKTSLHSFEHALFSYITSQQILHRPVDLYYAFNSLDEVRHQVVTPYLFKGYIRNKRMEEGSVRVTFDSIR